MIRETKTGQLNQSVVLFICPSFVEHRALYSQKHLTIRFSKEKHDINITAQLLVDVNYFHSKVTWVVNHSI